MSDCLVKGKDEKNRCFWVGENKEFYEKYHDEEWGQPIYDDRTHFEFLSLEGAQAGLSWETILKKREGYRKSFYNFEVKKIIKMTDDSLEKLRENPKIIRNRLKINSVRNNAKVFIEIQKEFGSFNDYIWNYVNHKPIINAWDKKEDAPAFNELSDIVSKDLKKRGMKFVGSTIIYSYLQAAGIIVDHFKGCWKCSK